MGTLQPHQACAWLLAIFPRLTATWHTRVSQQSPRVSQKPLELTGISSHAPRVAAKNAPRDRGLHRLIALENFCAKPPEGVSRWKALPARGAEVPVSAHARDFRRPSGAAFETFPRRSGSFPSATVKDSSRRAWAPAAKGRLSFKLAMASRLQTKACGLEICSTRRRQP